MNCRAGRLKLPKVAEREMMRAFHDKPSTVNAFDYYLAEKLGMSPSEVRAMDHRDYVELAAYFKVKHVLQDMSQKHSMKGK